MTADYEPGRARPSVGELREGIDEAWLKRAAATDPVLHAYATWDRERLPDRVRFVSAVEGEETVAYRLEWRAPGGEPPMIHWVGPPTASPLLERWPERPFLAVVPEERGPDLERMRGPTRTYPIEVRELRGEVPQVPAWQEARRLGPADRSALDELIRREPEWLLQGYARIPLDEVPCWGSFDGRELVAVARANVTLPRVWILNGIVTRSDRRSRGHGRAVTAAAARAARAEGAVVGLYHRADNAPARRLYDQLGFRTIARLLWVDAGVDRPP